MSVYVGIDVHRKRSQVAVVDAKCEVLAAEILADLRVPPGNRLEQLAGDRPGQYSIRINQQWRICFRWTDAGPESVEITDYR
jgi:toxin HigB-1